MPDVPTWIARYTATRLGFPVWAESAPERLALVSNRGGSWQAWAHDRDAGTWRQVTSEPVGVEEVRVLPDGRIAWFQDDSGAETGRWLAEPFEGGGANPLFPDLPTGWSMGMAMARTGRAAVGLEVGGEYQVHVVEPDGTSRVVQRAATALGVGGAWDPSEGGISPDGRYLVLLHTDHGDVLRPALRLLDLDEDDREVASFDDRPRRVEAGPWSDDGAYAFANELGDRTRPSVWRAGERRDLAVDLPGDVFPVAWFPGGRHLLVRHEFEARSQLHRLDVETGATELLADPHGDIAGAGVRPDGAVWLHAGDGTAAPATVDVAGTVVIGSPDAPAPPGHPVEDVWATNPHGERIHALLMTPEGEGPFPLVVNVHGGPEWHERPAWDPELLAFLDAGYAVASPNYRGSTGYGVAHREALIGNVCWTESEDIIAVLDHLIAEGIADPDRVYWSGWSWGGCLACFHAGVHPDRFRAIFAGIPAGDFVAAHWACAPELRAWDDAVYGGSPDDVPEAYARSDPMTYVHAVRTPTIVVAGEHDPRCPIEGVTPWVDAVRAGGTEVELITYGAGHHANGMDQQVAHMRRVLAFFARHA